MESSIIDSSDLTSNERRVLIVDGEMSGTGVRDCASGRYIDLMELNIPNVLVKRIKSWINAYWEEQYINFPDIAKINWLDQDGIDISRMLRNVLQDVDVKYFSSAETKYIEF